MLNPELQRKLEAKESNEIPNYAKKEIHLVTYNPDSPPNIIGSYSYRMQKYPADIDLMDNVSSYRVHGKWEAATDMGQIISSFAKRISEIARAIEREKGHYLLDFKAGVDERYLFRLGDMNSGNLSIDPNFIPNVKARFNAGMYTGEEVKAIEDLIKISMKGGSDNGQLAYDGITKILRKRYIQRWTLSEIIEGKKMLPRGGALSMKKALAQHQLVKMDLAVELQGRMIEVSNIWSLFYYDVNKHEYTYMTPMPKLENVPFDIEKLYWSNMFYSPFKVIKRIFSYARLMYLRGDSSMERYINKTFDMVRGDVSQLYQIRSELTTILDVHQLYGHVMPKQVDRQIDGIKARLANNLRLSGKVAEQLSSIIEAYLKHPISDHGGKMKILEDVKEMLDTLINDFSLRFLINTGMNPPPLDLLPTTQSAEHITREGVMVNPFCPIQHQKTYNWSITRYPNHTSPMGGSMGRIPNYGLGDALTRRMDNLETIAKMKRAMMISGAVDRGGCGECGGSESWNGIERDPSCPCCHGLVCEELYPMHSGGFEWGDVLSVGKNVLSHLWPIAVEQAPAVLEAIAEAATSHPSAEEEAKKAKKAIKDICSQCRKRDKLKRAKRSKTLISEESEESEETDESDESEESEEVGKKTRRVTRRKKAPTRTQRARKTRARGTRGRGQGSMFDDALRPDVGIGPGLLKGFLRGL